MAAITLPSFTRALSQDSLRLFQRAVTQGADINAPDGSGWTALHRAVHDGKDDWVERLLQQGANPNQGIATGPSQRPTPDTGDRPLHLALSINHPGIMHRLIHHGADVKLPNGDGKDLAAFALTCDPVLHPLAQQAQVWAEERDLRATLGEDGTTSPPAPAASRRRL